MLIETNDLALTCAELELEDRHWDWFGPSKKPGVLWEVNVPDPEPRQGDLLTTHDDTGGISTGARLPIPGTARDSM